MRSLWRASVVAVTAVSLVGLPLAAAETVSDAVVERPTEVTGRLHCTSYWQSGSLADVVLGPLDSGYLVRRETRGFEGGVVVDEMSDPRLAGTHRIYVDTDEYIGPEPLTYDHLGVWSATHRIEDDIGAWQGSDTAFYLEGTYEPVPSARWDQLVLLGEGGYEGLSALLELRLQDVDCYCWAAPATDGGWCSWELRGVILAGSPPPAPERGG